jgi:hypothetical protein
VEPDAGLTGVPVGDQTPRNPGAEHIEETVRETGESVGLAIPEDRPHPRTTKSVLIEDFTPPSGLPGALLAVAPQRSSGGCPVS